ncbi:MAG: hypothetical protein AB8B93_19135 [Pseudomonadales bacterium]
MPEGATRNRLCDLLFADAADPRAALRWALSQLRTRLGARDLLSESPVGLLSLNRAAVGVDVEQMHRWTEDLRQDPAAPCGIAAADFCLAHRGEALAELTCPDSLEYEEWRLTARSSLERRLRVLLELSIGASESVPKRLELSRALVRIDPLSEQAWATLVRSLSEAGELLEAQRVRDQARLRFTNENIAMSGQLDRALQVAAKPEAARRPSRRPRLAVMPCRERGSVADDDLCVLVQEAVYAAASTNRVCALLARSVTSQSASPESVAESDKPLAGLAADLLLEPCVTAVAGGYLVQLELVKSADGTCLFQWQHNSPESAIAAMGAELTALFSARFEIDLQIALIGLAYGRPPAERDLWDQYFLALPRIYSPQGHDPEESLNLLQNVIDEEPSMGPAVAAAAWVRTTHPSYNESAHEIRITAQMARRAMELSQDDTFTMALTAVVLVSTERDLLTALDLVRRALMFNPHSTMGRCAEAIVLHYMGDHRAALGRLAQAEALTDTEPLTFMLYAFRSLCHYMLDEKPQALHWAQKSRGRNPGFVVGQRALVLALVACGERQQATDAAIDLQTLDPSEHLEFYERQLAYAEPADRLRLLHDMAVAGVREDGRAS